MLDPRLLGILRCPASPNGTPCHGKLDVTPEGLRCLNCGLIYPVENDIPVMLVDRARKGESCD